jgi:hypothetical protein
MSDIQFIEYHKCIQNLNTLQQKHNSTISVAISKVTSDIKSDFLNSKTFISDNGAAFSDKKIEEITRWLEKLIPIVHQRKVSINVPAPDDIKEGVNVSTFFSGIEDANPTYYIRQYIDSRKQKIREPLKNGLITNADLKYPYDLEVSIPGYEDIYVELRGTTGVEETKTLDKLPIVIGMEKFSGIEHGVPEILSNSLIKNKNNFEVVNPERLKELRDQIKQLQDEIYRNPMLQTQLRRNFGVDYIISGSVTDQLDR